MADPSAEPDASRPWASRGALKLRHALTVFGMSARGLRCVDLGCSTGGFTDCLLRDGAARVIAIDTGYGVLDYRLRTDPRVVVRERTNALHSGPENDGERADLVTIDLGWTAQRLGLPAGMRWLREDPAARIITLIKPHYERSAREKGARGRGDVILSEEESRAEAAIALEDMPGVGALPLAVTPWPSLNQPARDSVRKARNLEWLALVGRAG